MTAILSAQRWRTNAHLIAAVAELYLDRAMVAVDVTYGRGKWWTQWAPDELVPHGIANGNRGHYDDGVDFRALPHLDETFDLAAFDPPYVSIGGRSTMAAAGEGMAHAFGMTTSSTSPASNQQLIRDGLVELHRVLRPAARHRGRYTSGIALVKVANYVSSGRRQPGVYWTIRDALDIGFEVLDELVFLTSGGPQPSTTKCRTCDGTGRLTPGGPEPEEIVQCPECGLDHALVCLSCAGAGRRPRVQRHARNNYSTLLVLTKGPQR